MSAQTKIVFILLLCLVNTRGQDFFSDFGSNLRNSIQMSLQPLGDLQYKIQQDMKQQMAKMSNLGQRISEQVNRGLEPVRIAQSLVKIKEGADGITIASFSPGGYQFIVRNGKYFTCQGILDPNSGRCNGNLQKLAFQRREDFCFVTSKSAVNDWYCLTPNSDSKSVRYINGRIVCETQDNSPKLLIEAYQYENMCRNIASSVTYKYITNSPLEYVGYGISCSRSMPQVCTYSERLDNNSGTYLQV